MIISHLQFPLSLLTQMDWSWLDRCDPSPLLKLKLSTEPEVMPEMFTTRVYLANQLLPYCKVCNIYHKTIGHSLLEPCLGSDNHTGLPSKANQLEDITINRTVSQKYLNVPISLQDCIAQ